MTCGAWPDPLPHQLTGPDESVLPGQWAAPTTRTEGDHGGLPRQQSLTHRHAQRKGSVIH